MSKDTTKIGSRLDPFLLLIPVLVALSSARVWFLHDVIWDDNAWLQIIYSSSSLQEFLARGFVELRRVPLGSFLYPLLTLHKSSPDFYMVWHTIDTLTEIASPMLLYLLMRNLFQGKRLLAFFIAISFVAFHLDHTLGYVSAVNYKVGLLLSLLSFYLTERGLASDSPRAACLLGAILASGVAGYVFIEATVALEPARLFLMGYMLRRKLSAQRVLIRRTIALWSPFLVLSMPLVLHKLLYKPFGLYEGAYATHHLSLQVLKNLVALIYFECLELFYALHYPNTWSLALGLCTVWLSFWVLWKLPTFVNTSLQTPAPDSHTPFNLPSERVAVWLGLAFLLPPMLLFLYADRALGGNMNSSHAALLQIGTAMLIGAGLFGLYSASSCLQVNARLIGVGFLASMIGLGNFANNKYLDLYFQSWAEQTRFWQAFAERFPSLPDRASFFVDVQDDAHFSDLKIYYDFEFQMNLLYAISARPEEFHRYRVYTLEEWQRLQSNRQAGEFTEEGIARETHFGMEVLDPKDLIFIYYRKGNLLINREIIERYPNVPYKAWLDKEFPALPPPSSYILRHKLEGLL